MAHCRLFSIRCISEGVKRNVDEANKALCIRIIIAIEATAVVLLAFFGANDQPPILHDHRASDHHHGDGRGRKIAACLSSGSYTFGTASVRSHT